RSDPQPRRPIPRGEEARHQRPGAGPGAPHERRCDSRRRRRPRIQGRRSRDRAATLPGVRDVAARLVTFTLILAAFAAGLYLTAEPRLASRSVRATVDGFMRARMLRDETTARQYLSN